MQRIALLLVSVFLLTACSTKKKKEQFEVTGTLSNAHSKTLYLEEVPMAAAEGMIVDSAIIDARGHYSLHASPKETSIYNLRLGGGDEPIASFINDKPSITLNVELTNGEPQYADKYVVQNSPASQQMKDFMDSFGEKLRRMIPLLKDLDSLSKKPGQDSLLNQYAVEQQGMATEISSSAARSIKQAGDPALTMFELGYYQSVAGRNPQLRLNPFPSEMVRSIIDETQKRFPANQGVANVKKTFEREEQEDKDKSLMGKQAPDFSLPDVNGKMISVSSFKGKYLLVDFWASWCHPCREENPNVVKAYNRFKDKNFTILGVSLDRPGQKDEWLKAIKDDQLDWNQVSELKYWSSLVVPLYHIEGIPYNVLIDPNGIIIAESLQGDKLENKLAEVLK